jgi:hypothetical protein
LLFAASASNKEDQVPAAPAARPAPSTPASTNHEQAVFNFEVQLQQKLMKDGYLVPPGPNASPTEKKAYEYVLESKAGGQSDKQALREAAQRIMDEREREHAIRVAARKQASQEQRAIEQKKVADRKNVPPPDVAARFQANPKPTVPTMTGPAFTEDPENPLPKATPRQ